MEDWQVSLMMQAQALAVRAEGMKASNAISASCGAGLTYSEPHFIEIAQEVEALARAMVQR